jgi:chlorobactene glucosyltransferase
MTFWLVYHLLVAALLVLMLVSLAANLFVFRSLQAAPPQSASRAPQPLVSVLVPARNEARRIAECVQSLLAQDYSNYELLVLDDQSEDATMEILRGLGLQETGDVRRRILRGEPLPSGWTGKCWACDQLAKEARGEWLFFTDADTEHSSGTIRAALAQAQKTRADLFSAWPRLVTKTLGEKLVIPVIHLMAAALYPHMVLALFQRHPELAQRYSRSALRLLGGANGQFLFFKRTAYEAIGGHAAVRDHLVEDVALGREIAMRIGEGMRLVNCDASRMVRCRMYCSLAEVWEGFTKNIRPAFENALALWWISGAMVACCFFLPFVFVVFASQRCFAFVEIALIYLLRVILAARFRTSWIGCILHPIGIFLAMCIGVNSWRRAGTRGVTWKGRVYRTGAGKSGA